MLDGLWIRIPVILQHILDQVNPATRAVQLIAKHLIGGASGRAKPTVNAGAQDIIAALDRWIL
jgi:hypothetical protein